MKKKSSSRKNRNVVAAFAVSALAVVSLATFHEQVSTAAASVMHRAAVSTDIRESNTNCIYVKGFRELMQNNFHFCRPDQPK